MKLTEETKNKIDNYFNNTTAEALLDVAVDVYGLKEKKKEIIMKCNDELSNNVFICECGAEHILTNSETLYLCRGSVWLYKCSVCGKMERATSKNTKKRK